jgi:hypothetical protein
VRRIHPDLDARIRELQADQDLQSYIEACRRLAEQSRIAEETAEQIKTMTFNMFKKR